MKKILIAGIALFTVAAYGQNVPQITQQTYKLLLADCDAMSQIRLDYINQLLQEKAALQKQVEELTKQVAELKKAQP